MRTTMMLLMLVVGALTWMAYPAKAGDDDAARIASLEADVVRLKTEATHMREAYKALSENKTLGAKAVMALTTSLKASADMLVALTAQRDELRVELKQLRAAIAKRPDDDPARLKLALRDEREQHAAEVARMRESIDEWTKRANLHSISMFGAQNALTLAKSRHASEVTRLVAKLAEAGATIKQLRGGK